MGILEPFIKISLFSIVSILAIETINDLCTLMKCSVSISVALQLPPTFVLPYNPNVQKSNH
jgi:hypothetical protein